MKRTYPQVSIHLQRMKRPGRLIFALSQLLQGKLKLTLGGQGNGTEGATFKADLAAGEAANRMGHKRPAGFGVPLEDVVRTEIKAL